MPAALWDPLSTYRLWPIALVAACIALALPASASAASFYVDQATGDSANDCTTPADPCASIGEGVSKTAANAEVDTLFLAPGTYASGIVLSSAEDVNGLTIKGSGSGSDPATDTIISYTDLGTAVTIGGPPEPPVDGVTIEDLRVTVPLLAPMGTDGVTSFGTNFALRRVAISMENPSGNGRAVSAGRGPLTLDHVTAATVKPDFAMVLGAYDLTVLDSAISSAGPGVITQTGNAATSHTTRIERSSISGSGSGGYAISTNMVDLVIDSSLVRGGQAGVLFSSQSGAVRRATLRNSTIDGETFSTFASAGHSGTQALIDIENSILLDPQTAAQDISDGSASSVTCTSSDALDQVQSAAGGLGAIDCPSNLNGNSHTATSSDLFANLAGGDYHLKASSPAVDTGSTSPLAAGQSTTDRDGKPRILDGNVDCVMRRDKGAYEFGTNTVPVAQITAPGNGSVGTPVNFAGDATDDEPAGSLAFRWAFSGGGTAVTQNTTHAFGAPGAQQATLEVTDSAGCVGSAVKPITIAALPVPPIVLVLPDKVGATIAKASMTNTHFAVTNRARKVKRGTRFLFTLSEPAAVKVTIEQRLPGRKVGKSCRKPTAKLRKKKACKRYVRKGSLATAGKQGANTLPFSGKLKGKPLKLGAYRARISAKDAAGNPSVNQPALTFRIVRG